MGRIGTESVNRIQEYDLNLAGKITLRDITTAFVFLVSSGMFTLYGISDSAIYDVIGKATGAVVILLFIVNRSKMDMVLLSSVMIYVYLFAVTIFTDGSYSRIFGKAFAVIVINMYTSYCCSSKIGLRLYIRSLANFFLAIVIINFLSFIVLPTSITDGGTYLIGLKNQMVFALTIGFLACYLDKYYNNCNRKLYIYLVLYVSTLVIVNNRAGMVAAAILVVFTFFPFVKRLLNRYSLFTYFVVLVIGILFVVSFSTIVFNIPVIKYVIVNILNKDTTLGSRTDIWAEAIYSIIESPIFGHGVRDTYNLFTIHSINGTQVFSAHNQYIQALYEGGIVGMVLVSVPVYLLSKNLKNIDSDVAAGLKITVIALAVVLASEAVEWKTLLCVINIGAAICYTSGVSEVIGIQNGGGEE